MHKIKFIFLGSILLILVGCANVLVPPPEFGLTAAQLPSMCTTVNQNVTKDSTIYYVKADKESTVVKQCRFKAANVYFSSTAWKALNKILSDYDSNVRINPIFKYRDAALGPSANVISQKAFTIPSTEIFSINSFMLRGRLLTHGDDNTEHHLFLTLQSNGTWSMQQIDDMVSSNYTLF